jgi:GNAT superfamily N-acetyltransferase
MNIRTMTAQDIPAGMRLKETAGWNQTEADWKRFLESSPQGCFVAELDNHVCGTVTTIVFEGRFAWVGMVLVNPEYRGQGIGTRLLERAIEYLESLNVPAIKLDATPQGKPLYEKLGFVSEYEIERWILRRVCESSLRPSQPAAAAEFPASILNIDRQAFGADRSSLLRSIHRDAPQFSVCVTLNGLVQGYSFGRIGTYADHLGPWMASDPFSARQLLETFLGISSRENVFVDWLKANTVTGNLLKSSGFTYSRKLTRMYRGRNEFPGQPQMLCAILGPEFG